MSRATRKATYAPTVPVVMDASSFVSPVSKPTYYTSPMARKHRPTQRLQQASSPLSSRRAPSSCAEPSPSSPDDRNTTQDGEAGGEEGGEARINRTVLSTNAESRSRSRRGGGVDSLSSTLDDDEDGVGSNNDIGHHQHHKKEYHNDTLSTASTIENDDGGEEDGGEQYVKISSFVSTGDSRGSRGRERGNSTCSNSSNHSSCAAATHGLLESNVSFELFDIYDCASTLGMDMDLDGNVSEHIHPSVLRYTAPMTKTTLTAARRWGNTTNTATATATPAIPPTGAPSSFRNPKAVSHRKQKPMRQQQRGGRGDRTTTITGGDGDSPETDQECTPEWDSLVERSRGSGGGSDNLGVGDRLHSLSLSFPSPQTQRQQQPTLSIKAQNKAALKRKREVSEVVVGVGVGAGEIRAGVVGQHRPPTSSPIAIPTPQQQYEDQLQEPPQSPPQSQYQCQHSSTLTPMGVSLSAFASSAMPPLRTPNTMVAEIRWPACTDHPALPMVVPSARHNQVEVHPLDLELMRAAGDDGSIPGAIVMHQMNSNMHSHQQLLHRGQHRFNTRRVQYACTYCQASYEKTTETNAWWAVEKDICPHCNTLQYPTIDIDTPMNAMHLDPNTAVIYREGLKEEQQQEHIEEQLAKQEYQLEQQGGYTNSGSICSSKGSIRDTGDNTCCHTPHPHADNHATPTPTNVYGTTTATSPPSMTPDLGQRLRRCVDTTHYPVMFHRESNGTDDYHVTTDHGSQYIQYGYDVFDATTTTPFTAHTLKPKDAAQLLLLMTHARQCRTRHSNPAAQDACSCVKLVMLHARDCNGFDAERPDKACTRAWCRPVKHLVSHLAQCKKRDECPVCCPSTLPTAFKNIRLSNNSKNATTIPTTTIHTPTITTIPTTLLIPSNMHENFQ